MGPARSGQSCTVSVRGGGCVSQGQAVSPWASVFGRGWLLWAWVSQEGTPKDEALPLRRLCEGRGIWGVEMGEKIEYNTGR